MRRRDFLKQTAVAAVALSASSLCAFAFGQRGLDRSGAPKRVIIVGAGLAGLSAAYELTQAGHDVTVLEARTRPGGRVHTLRDPFAEGLYAEAGATRIPNHHHFTLEYAGLFGLTLDPFQPRDVPSVCYVRGQRIRMTPGQKVEWPYDLTTEERALGLNGMRQKYIWSMLSEVGDATDPGWPSRELLKKYDRMNRSDFWRSRGASSEAVALLSVGGIDDRVDARSTLLMLRVQALNQKLTQYYKIRGGNDLLPKAFASRLSEKIHYSTAVVKIELHAHGVKVTFRQAGAYHGQPGTRGILRAAPISVHSRRVTAMSESERISFALEQVDTIYPGMRNHFEGGVTKCWDDDEWARGASAYYKPGQFSSLLPHVARPEGRIHFAGEHTSVWIDGWMQGALESGNRVAREVNAAA